MHKFEVTVRLDTPLLQGGSSSLIGMQDTRSGWCLDTNLREQTIRGLIHTFARAMFLPQLGGNHEEVRRAENLLLGSTAGQVSSAAMEYGRTIFVETALANSEYSQPKTASFSNRPGQNKGTRQGIKEGQFYYIRISLGPWIQKNRENHINALWSVLWTGLCFGSIGIRSRRGYGGLAPVILSSIPEKIIDELSLPLFRSLPGDERTLAIVLQEGLKNALIQIQVWLSARGFSISSSSVIIDDPFQILGPQYVYVGTKQGTWENDIMKKFLDESSRQLGINRMDHQTIIGRIKNGRLSSPVWLRIMKIEDGYVPIITLGSSNTIQPPAGEGTDCSDRRTATTTRSQEKVTPKPIVQALLDSVAAQWLPDIASGKTSRGGTL